MSEPGTLANVTIHIEGVGNPVSYTALCINQQLADVNDFSFNWRQESGTGSLAGYISFNRTHLAAEVTIEINNVFTFKGIIFAINCVEQDSNGITYEIMGKGLFAKLLEIPSCNTFYQKDLSHIFNTLNITQGTTLQLNPSNTSTLFYTVQYNQSAFNFYKMLAARHGEWLYYNGQELVLGPPQGSATDISDHEIDNLTFCSRIEQPPMNAVSYDAYQGEVIQSTDQVSPPGGTGFIATNLQAGTSIISPSEFATFSYNGAVTSDLLSAQSLLLQKGRAAASSTITGNTYNPNLKLAGKINITDNSGNNFGEYIITELHHYSSDTNNYQNYFSAIPSEAEAPPYTNPLLHASCPAQMAVVIENEDEDGHDRVKVRFPWMQTSETTPWLRIVSPHAGEGYGFRFVPEIDDLVYVDFTDNNPEQPFVMGGVSTGNRRSGIPHDGNHIKTFGTRTGRRLEIDDNRGLLKLTDNVNNENPRNVLLMKNNDEEVSTNIQVLKDDNNASILALDADRGCMISVVKDGDTILSIKLSRNSEKIEIHAKNNIELTSDEDIKLNAKNIILNAQQEVNIEGTSAVNITSPQTEIEGTGTATLKGATVEVKGDGMASVESPMTEIKGSGMTTITGGIVMIN